MPDGTLPELDEEIAKNLYIKSVQSDRISVCRGIPRGFSATFLAKLAERYFKHELAAGTPFTQEGADELKRLGICTIVIPFCSMIGAQVIYQIANQLFSEVADLHIDGYAQVGLGIAFIVVSLICRYGAEQNNIITQQNVIE